MQKSTMWLAGQAGTREQLVLSAPCGLMIRDLAPDRDHCVLRALVSQTRS